MKVGKSSGEKLAMNEIKKQTNSRHLETMKHFKDINDIPIQKIDSTMLKQLILLFSINHKKNIFNDESGV